MTHDQINALLKSVALDATADYCRRHGIPTPVIQDNRPSRYAREIEAVRVEMAERQP